jgi:hypothetical protein
MADERLGKTDQWHHSGDRSRSANDCQIAMPRPSLAAAIWSARKSSWALFPDCCVQCWFVTDHYCSPHETDQFSRLFFRLLLIAFCCAHIGKSHSCLLICISFVVICFANHVKSPPELSRSLQCAHDASECGRRTESSRPSPPMTVVMDMRREREFARMDVKHG